MAGALIAFTANAWLAVGSSFAGVQEPPLPTTTEHCVTAAYNNYSTLSGNTTDAPTTAVYYETTVPNIPRCAKYVTSTEKHSWFFYVHMDKVLAI